jgi:hypothetical protein
MIKTEDIGRIRSLELYLLASIPDLGAVKTDTIPAEEITAKKSNDDDTSFDGPSSRLRT